MLQMAYANATLVSGGQRFAPRLARETVNTLTNERTPVPREAVEALPYKPEHVELITKALYGVTQEGTSVRSFVGAPFKTGGKTGTAQAVGIKANEKYNAAKMSEYQRDHSLYIAHAPIEAPTIALAVIVENSGFGSEAAAPIARRVFDYLLAGLWPSEEDIAATREGKSTGPIGKQRRAAEVPLPGMAGPAAGAASAAAAAASAPATQRVAAGAPVLR